MAMMRHMLSLAWASAAMSAELTYPNVIQAETGWHNLSLGPVAFLDYGFNTRGFDGKIPGPTFRAFPGESIKVRLQNNLNPADDKTCSITKTEFCESETTNMHTHGLHVSSKGIVDGLQYNSDNIFVAIPPGQTSSFSFDIPVNHAPGTHWYHPHHHHATALQAGGGAAGVIIIEDPPGYLPSEYSVLQERILFVSYIDLASLQGVALDAQSTLLSNAATLAGTANKPTGLYLVNGQLNPTVTITGGEWYRFRIVFAAIALWWEMVPVGATCQFRLLAKDGIYLNSVPRVIDEVILYPGARSDIAVQCTCASYPCTATSAPEGSANNILSFNVVQGSGTNAAELPPFVPTRPCYLADLRKANVPAANVGALALQGGPRKVTWNGNGNSMKYAATHTTAGAFNASNWPPIGTLTAGQVYEMSVTGFGGHPLHIHVNPYQITYMLTSTHGGYFQVGDWHDTAMLTSWQLLGFLKIRMQVTTFTGKMVVHCHKLKHEDQGMMGYFQIDASGNNQYTCAESLDVKCYRTAFSPNAVSNTQVDNACFGSGSSTPAMVYFYFIGIPLLLVLLICGGVGCCVWRRRQAPQNNEEEIELQEARS